MHARTRKHTSSLALLGLGALLLGGMLFFFPPHAISASATSVIGYAWSDNIGWVSFNCSNTSSCGTSNYGLWIASDGTVSGYAWSDNIGWISAQGADVSGCPSAPCTPAINITTGAMTGWFRALAYGGGWDGWISLSGAGYGPMLTGGAFRGYAWGSTVVGWLSFAGLAPSATYYTNELTSYTASHYNTGPFYSQAQTTFQPCVPNSNVCMDGQTIRHYNADCTYTDAICQFASYGYGCSGNACLVPPSPGEGSVPGGITATPRLVRTGNTVQVSWDVASADPASCTVTGSNGDFWNGLASSTKTSSPITEQTTYLLHCNGSAVNILTYDAQAVVNIVPTFKET
ncbi:DUF5320 domain-containing protein [Candidatus Kaiserbacteria bacterium]|nr:DUF5320 domain-containing protein [Candidatus Kaiserbacteria bacterium]